MSIKPIEGAGAWRPFRDQAVPVPSSSIGDSPQLSICFNADWLVPIATALKAMMRPEFWAGDTQDAINSACIDAASVQIKDGCMGDIQFRSPSACVLEFSDDGGSTWTQIFDAQACVLQDIHDGIIAPGAAQPTDTGGIPGNCNSFNMVVPANGAVALPVLVSTGDTIQLSNIDIGPWIDSIATMHGYCSDGHNWALPAGCGTTELAHENDPLQTANHMALIAKIGDDYYDVSGGDLITVPSGVTDATVILQANDDILWDNLFSIGCTAEVCKAGYTHTFDFTVSDQGWTPVVTSGFTRARYVAGVGWHRGYDSDDYSDRVSVEISTPGSVSTTVDKMEVYVNDCALLNNIGMYWGGSFPYVSCTGGKGQFIETHATTQLVIDITNPRDKDPYIVKVIVTGQGSDPWA